MLVVTLSVCAEVISYPSCLGFRSITVVLEEVDITRSFLIWFPGFKAVRSRMIRVRRDGECVPTIEKLRR